MKNYLTPLTSRKFLLAAAGLLTLAANEQWTEFVVVLMGYLGFNTAAAVVPSAKKK